MPHRFVVRAVSLRIRHPLEPLGFVELRGLGAATGSDHAAIAAQAVEQAYALDAFRMPDCIGGEYRAAPILPDEGDAVQIEIVDERGEILDMGLERVGAILRRLALSESHVVGHDDPPVFRKGRNELPVDVPPGRLAMEADDRLALALVHVMHAESGSRAESWLERKGSVEGFVSWDHAGTIIG